MKETKKRGKCFRKLRANAMEGERMRINCLEFHD